MGGDEPCGKDTRHSQHNVNVNANVQHLCNAVCVGACVCQAGLTFPMANRPHGQGLATHTHTDADTDTNVQTESKKKKKKIKREGKRGESGHHRHVLNENFSFQSGVDSKTMQFSAKKQCNGNVQ